MTITTSRAGTVIDALVAACKLSATFADPVAVNDGPVVTGQGVVFTQAIYLGYDGNWQGEYEAATTDQTMPYVGNTTTEEQLEIRCCAEAWSGDPTWQTLRNQALTLIAGVATIIRTDPTLGIDGTTIARLQMGSMYQLPPGQWGVEPFSSNGSMVRWSFIVHVQTTLMTV